MEFRRNPPHFLRDLALQYGDIAHFKLGGKSVVQLNHPDLIHEVLVTKGSNFKKTSGLDAARQILGNGLVRSEGEFHRRQRRLIQPAFQPTNIAQYAATVMQVALQANARWHSGQMVDIFQEMLRVAADVAARVFFHADIEDEFDQICRDMTVVFEYLNLLIVPFSRFLAKFPSSKRHSFFMARQRLDTIIFEMIAKRRAKGETSNDLLGLLLAEKEAAGGGMTDQQIRDELMTMFIAGHETTATLLTWTWYCLASHPQVEEALHAELDAVLSGKPPTFHDIPRLRFTHQVICECMRLYPPVWAITRLAINDCSFGDWCLPQGTTIGISQYVMHRDPRFYPNPERFDPSRWESESIAKRPKYAFFPFGGGSRVCIGERFAWMETTLILATLAQTWRACLPPGIEPEFQPLITLRPRGGLTMKIQLR